MKKGDTKVGLFVFIIFLAFSLSLTGHIQAKKNHLTTINFLETKLLKLTSRYANLNLMSLRNKYAVSNKWNFFAAIANFFRRIVQAIVRVVMIVVNFFKRVIDDIAERIRNAREKQRKDVVQENNSFINQINLNPENNFKVELNKFSKLLPVEMQPFFSLKSPPPDSKYFIYLIEITSFKNHTKSEAEEEFLFDEGNSGPAEESLENQIENEAKDILNNNKICVSKRSSDIITRRSIPFI
jgi:hypothetical protein